MGKHMGQYRGKHMGQFRAFLYIKDTAQLLQEGQAIRYDKIAWRGLCTVFTATPSAKASTLDRVTLLPFSNEMVMQFAPARSKQIKLGTQT